MDKPIALTAIWSKGTFTNADATVTVHPNGRSIRPLISPDV